MVEGRVVETVLVVDDTASNVALVRAVLKDHYRLKVATSGSRALEICDEDEKPDLVLLDVSMPQMDGFEVCKRLKANPETESIPIIFVSAMSDTTDETKGLRLGAVDYVIKPITPSILVSRIRTHLQLKAAMDQIRDRASIMEEMVRERTQVLSRLNEALSKFVPLEFLRAIGHTNIAEVRRGDHVFGEMTIMKFDIRSYTRLAEHMTPEEVFAFTNGFHGRMTPIVRAHGGFIQQYQGDGAICVFPKAPLAAIDCAIAMQRKLTDYNTEREGKGRERLGMGIGLHSGPLMVGVLGDEDRWESGVPSDTVNTAARVESLTKYFGVGVVMSGATADLVDLDGRDVRFLSEVQVEGKEHPLRIYEIFAGDPPGLAASKTKAKSKLVEGQRLLEADDAASAIKCFTDALEIMPNDFVTRYYLKKASERLLRSSPATSNRVLRIDKQ